MKRTAFSRIAATIVVFGTLVGVPEAAGDEGMFDVQRGQLALAEDLRRNLDGADATEDRDVPFKVARLAVEHRSGLVGGALPEAVGPMLGQQLLNLEAARDFVAIGDAGEDELAGAVAYAKRAARLQAATLGLPWMEPVPLVGHEVPSAALRDLVERHGLDATEEEWMSVRELDELEEPLRTALARYVDAFLALDEAGAGAFAEVDAAALEGLRDAMEGRDDASGAPSVLSPGDALRDVGIDLTRVFPTRNQFLDAILDLRDAIAEVGIQTASACAPVKIAPAFSIDVTSCGNTYTADFALLLDAGGRDVFHNNAGGSNLAGGSCTLFQPAEYAVAVLVDLDGNDAYGNPTSVRECGANGGGFGVGGFLLDAGGDDTYTAGGLGTNGGGGVGVGFLLDAGGGRDLYTSGAGATNGGGNVGVGFLFDGGGNDAYTAGRSGTNGGGALAGIGLLIDAAGSDAYTAADYATNGGGRSGGAGFLLDLAGHDRYTATSEGTNGGGMLGVGFLLDAAGDDAYRATSDGTNGGGRLGGAGLLLDVDGSDVYTAGDLATNGGGSGGAGFLFDMRGYDAYGGGSVGTNGGATLGAGFLLDAGQSDTYTGRDHRTNGGGGTGVAFLLDLDGTDRYQDPGIPGGSCWDCTLAPKGYVGLQIDIDP